MSLWSVFHTALGYADAFVNGYHTMAGLMHNGNGHAAQRGNAKVRGRIERLCRELGWTVDGREDGMLRLDFHHGELGTRSVRVLGGDDGLATLIAYSGALPPPANVPEEVLGYLLNRNVTANFGGWFADVTADGKAIFGVLYRILGDGTQAQGLKFICESMVGEVCAFDLTMKAAGLL